MRTLELQCGDVAVSITTDHFCVYEMVGGLESAHVHPSACVMFPLAGEVMERDGDEWLRCDSETAIVRSSTATHVGRFPKEARWILIQSLSAEAAQTLANLAEGMRVFRAPGLRPLFLRVWRELYQCDDAARVAADGAIFNLLAELSRMAATGHDRPKARLAAQLEALCARRPEGETLANLAALNQMSTRTYTQRFRLETGLSVAQYLAHIRAERAKTLLRTASLSVTEIALHLGYCDGSHFARAFYKTVGMTPSEYRSSFL